jgi:hypothetical protein
MDDEQTYAIKRFYHPNAKREDHYVEGMDGLTLEEAQDHCSDPDSSVAGFYFDGFVRE